MSEILSYFGEVIVLTAVSGILFAVAPEGNVKKYINFIISVCILAAVVAPMISAVTNLPEKIRLDDAFEDAVAQESEKMESAVVKASKNEIEKAICSLICTKFSLDEDVVSCEIELDTTDLSNIEITKIILGLPSSKNHENIKNYIDEMFLGKSEIIISEGDS